MKRRTDLEQVKAVAIALLLTEIHKTEFSPAVVQHPFTSSGIVPLRKDGQMQIADITQDENALKQWQDTMTQMINAASKPFDIYMMVNKPYALTFLKYSSPYLTAAELGKILVSAWMRSEKPNMDPNVSQSKLIALFKKADPRYLMDSEEQLQLAELSDPVTVYRGVTSVNRNRVHAMSWTLNPETAKWFAHRFGENGTVYEAKIQKAHILALFNGRNESEIVVDPSFLMNIEEVQEQSEALTMS